MKNKKIKYDVFSYDKNNKDTKISELHENLFDALCSIADNSEFLDNGERMEIEVYFDDDTDGELLAKYEISKTI